MQTAIQCRYFQKAFGWCIPIGGLAGLVGLGGGEFRLPVLMYAVGYPAKTAVPLNLIVSIVTLTFALVVRSATISVGALVPYLNEIFGFAAGGVVSAFYGARFVSSIKSEYLIKTISVLLAALGVLILVEVVFPFQSVQIIPHGVAIYFATGSSNFDPAIGLGFPPFGNKNQNVTAATPNAHAPSKIVGMETSF